MTGTPLTNPSYRSTGEAELNRTGIAVESENLIIAVDVDRDPSA